MRRSLGDVWSKSDIDIVEVADINLEGYRAAIEAFDGDVGLMVGVDDFRTAGVVKAAKMVDMLVLPAEGDVAFGVVRADNDRAGHTEKVRARRVEMGGGGKIDGVSERSSSTQLLLVCVTETILSPG